MKKNNSTLISRIFYALFWIFLRTKSTLPTPFRGGRYTLVRGERLNGIQEVSGSIPLISTKQKKEARFNAS